MTRKTRILMFIDWYLPGYRAGGPTRSCANLIEHLGFDFDFSIVTRDTDYMSDESYVGVKSDEWNAMPDGTRVYYFSSEQLSRKTIHGILKSEKYDYVYLNGIFSKYFTLIPLRYFKSISHKKVIVASRGMLAKSALAIKKNKKYLFLFFAKKIGLFDNVLFHATNEREASIVKGIFGENVKVHVAPNLSENRTDDSWEQRMKSKKVLKLVSVARIAPEKNIKYALEILKEIKADVIYDLFGPIYDGHYWSECKEIIKQLPGNITVNFMDSIESQKVSEIISNYDFLFLPTLGENFGHVILQSMQVGVPVIISNMTMWQQLENLKAGWDIPLSDKKKFVSLIEKCSKLSQEEYDVISRGAFDFASSYTNNKELIDQSRQLFVK